MQKFDTNRNWGDKVPPKTHKIKLDGHSLIIESHDFWEGPVEPGEQGHYVRGYWLAESV